MSGGAREDAVLWQSTFTGLLEITLTADARLRGVRPIDTGRGIYFGLTRVGDRTFVAARNLGPDGRITDPSRPSNTVVEFSAGEPSRDWAVDGIRGAHQIRWHDGLVWIMNCRAPELVAFDPAAGAVVGGVTLSDLVPPELTHAAPPEHPTDAYHFNSLDFAAGRLFVLAHNWGYGSFALELDYRDPADLFARPTVRAVHPGLGTQAHDVFADTGGLHVLDSGSGRLVMSGGRGHLVGRAGELSFARGLAVSRDHFFIGHGTFGPREDRITSPTYLTVLDRRTFAVTATREIGAYGNPCDLLLMSEPDWSDTGHPDRRRVVA